MAVYENDILIIPAEYKAMSSDELKKEKERLWKEIEQTRSVKEPLKANTRGIVFNI